MRAGYFLVHVFVEFALCTQGHCFEADLVPFPIFFMFVFIFVSLLLFLAGSPVTILVES